MYKKTNMQTKQNKNKKKEKKKRQNHIGLHV